MRESNRHLLVNLLSRFGGCDFSISTDGKDILEQSGNGDYKKVTDGYAIARLTREVRPMTELVSKVYIFLAKV